MHHNIEARSSLEGVAHGLCYSNLATHWLHTLTWLVVETQSDDVFEEKEALAALGLAQQVSRDISLLDIICIGWNICNSWAGVAGTLALTIALGGSVTPIYGAIVCFVMVGCSGLTMAELVSIYPTAGGQYVSLIP